MPPSTVSFNVNANVAPANKAIKSVHNNINKLGQPLGRITGDAAEFSKSLQAAAARVTAFGAIAGILTGISRGISGAAKSTIELNKELNELNSFLGTSRTQLDNFGKGLFDIARKTATDFKVVAEAAKEFARQGLSLEETLKRTNSALVLSRISGLGFAESVTSITSALNSFTKSALTAEQITNKLVAVDVKFAVSANDLAQAISRVGSSAEEAGLGIDQLSAAVTATQQITGRGGAVIGNSLKTIFTRVQRPEVLRQLQELGVVVKDQNGALLDAINIFRNYAAVRENLNQVERASTDELLGGVFQINQLKALTKDLASANSIYERALRTSTNATNEATQKNEQLNQSFSALFAQTATNAKQVGAQLGNDLFGPLFRSAPQTINGLLGIISGQDFQRVGEEAGGTLGKGIVSGIVDTVAKSLGSVLGQTLLPLAGFIGGGLALRLGGFGATAIKTGAKDLLGGAIFRKGLIQGNASGYIPAFAKEEAQARSMGAINPKARLINATIRGKTGPAIVNDQEAVFNVGGETAIIPKYRPLSSIPSFAVGGFNSRQRAFLKQITPEFLSKHSQDKTSVIKLFKDQGFLKDLQFDQKGSSRYFIPLNKEQGIKLAFNDAGVAQTQAEVGNAFRMSNLKYGSILPKTYSYDKKNHSWSIVERLNAPQNIDDPKFAKMFMKNVGKPRESFLKGKNVTDLEKRVINFAAENDLTLQDFKAGVNTGFTKLGDLKLLDTGLTRQMSMNYGGPALTPWVLNKGRIPSFPAGNIPYGVNPFTTASVSPAQQAYMSNMAVQNAQQTALIQAAQQNKLYQQQQQGLNSVFNLSLASQFIPTGIALGSQVAARRGAISPEASENLTLAGSATTGLVSAGLAFKNTPGPLPAKLIAAAIVSAPAFIQGITSFFSRGDLAKEMALEGLKKQSDKINEALSKNVGKIQELTQVYGKLEAAYNDPSTSPTAILELNKTAQDITRNLSRNAPDLVAQLATTTSPEERINILSEFNRKSEREAGLKNTILGFASNTNQNKEAFNSLFSSFTDEITADAMSGLKTKNLDSQSARQFRETLNELDLEEVGKFFDDQGENANKLLTAYRNYLSDTIEITRINEEIAKIVQAETKQLTRRKRELTSQKAGNLAGSNALQAGLSVISQNLGVLGGGATGALAFQASKDIATKTLEESKSLQNLISNEKAPDSIKNLLSSVPSAENARILSRAISTETFDNQPLNEEQLKALQNISIKNESSLAAIKEQTLISEETLRVQKEIANSVNKATSFAGGIGATTSAGSRNESFQELLRPFLKARLGMQFGSGKTVASGRAEFLAALSQQFPGSGIESSLEAIGARRSLQEFRKQDIIRSSAQASSLARGLGIGGVGLGIQANLAGDRASILARDQVEQLLPTGGTPSIANRFLEKFRTESLSALSQNKAIDAQIKSIEDISAEIRQEITEGPSLDIQNLERDIVSSIESGLKDVQINGANVNVLGEARVNFSSAPSSKSGGFIPSFANPLRAAIGRESQYVPASTIRVNQSNKLVNRMNPMGLAVTNTIDEPNGLASIGLASGGFIPNFAIFGNQARSNVQNAVSDGNAYIYDHDASAFYKVSRDFRILSNNPITTLPAGAKVISSELNPISGDKYVPRSQQLLNIAPTRLNKLDVLNRRTQSGSLIKGALPAGPTAILIDDILKANKGKPAQVVLNEINRVLGGDAVIKTGRVGKGDFTYQSKGVFGADDPLSIEDIKTIRKRFYSGSSSGFFAERKLPRYGGEFRVHVAVDPKGVARVVQGATTYKPTWTKAGSQNSVKALVDSGMDVSEAKSFIRNFGKAAERTAVQNIAKIAESSGHIKLGNKYFFGVDVSAASIDDAKIGGVRNFQNGFNTPYGKFVPFIHEINPSDMGGSSGILSHRAGSLKPFLQAIVGKNSPSSKLPYGIPQYNLQGNPQGIFSPYAMAQNFGSKIPPKKSFFNSMLSKIANSKLAQSAVQDFKGVKAGLPQTSLAKSLTGLKSKSTAGMQSFLQTPKLQMGLGLGQIGLGAYTLSTAEDAYDTAFGSLALASGGLSTANPLGKTLTNAGAKNLGSFLSNPKFGAIAQKAGPVLAALTLPYQMDKKGEIPFSLMNELKAYGSAAGIGSIFGIIGGPAGMAIGAALAVGTTAATRGAYQLGTGINKFNRAIFGKYNPVDVGSDVAIGIADKFFGFAGGLSSEESSSISKRLEEKLAANQARGTLKKGLKGQLDAAAAAKKSKKRMLPANLVRARYSPLVTKVRNFYKGVPREILTAATERAQYIESLGAGDRLLALLDYYRGIGYDPAASFQTRSGGFIPNFAGGMMAEMMGIATNPAYVGNRNAVPQMSSYYPNMIKNSAEIEVPAVDVYSRMGFPGAKPKNPSEQYAILNPAQQAALGYAADGFVPNFASDEFMSTMVSALEKVFSPMLNKMSSTGSTSNVINVNDQRTYETTSDKVDGIMEFLAQQFPREIGKLGINV
jgi:TP901 family phage tail tape measure protein